MLKLLPSLLLSVSVATALHAKDMDNSRDLLDSIENSHQTTATNPNPHVTGSIAHNKDVDTENYTGTATITFSVDPSSLLGQKILELAQFCAQVALANVSNDEQAYNQLAEEFGTLNPKEQQFVQTLVACNSALAIATQELANEVNGITEQDGADQE